LRSSLFLYCDPRFVAGYFDRVYFGSWWTLDAVTFMRYKSNEERLIHHTILQSI
jgi:hypothetical protein